MRTSKIYKQNTEAPEVGATKGGWRSPTGSVFLDPERRWQEAMTEEILGVGVGGQISASRLRRTRSTITHNLFSLTSES